MTGKNLNSHTAATFSAVKSKSKVILALFFLFYDFTTSGFKISGFPNIITTLSVKLSFNFVHLTLRKLNI